MKISNAQLCNKTVILLLWYQHQVGARPFMNGQFWCSPAWKLANRPPGTLLLISK